MKRKLVKQGSGGLTITLPIKWLRENTLKPGDEIDVAQGSDGSLSIRTENAKQHAMHVYSTDASTFSHFSLNALIRGLYRSKIDEIILNNPPKTIPYQKKKKKIEFLKVCERACNKLIGIEIIKKTKDQVILQCFISREDEEKIKIIERKIFLMVHEFMKDILSNLSGFSNFVDFSKTAYDRHDEISKFCDYYMRVIVHSSFPADVKAANFNLIELMHKFADNLRYLCDTISKQKKNSKKVKALLKDHFDLFYVYYQYLFSIGGIGDDELINSRYKVVHDMKEAKLNLDELKIMSEVSAFLLSLINEFFEVKRVNSIDKNELIVND